MLTMEGERALVILVLWIMSGRAARDGNDDGVGDGGSRKRCGRGMSMDVSDMTSSRQHRSGCGGAAYVRRHA